MTVYIVKHAYDVDGGFGDAIGNADVLCGFMDKSEAEAFVSKYSNRHVYSRPYADLECGILVLEELNMTPPKEEEMWWLHEEIS